MYQALYRKWRPRTFSDVCGQDAVTTALKNELKNDRLSHAYLFTGCRGTGKTTCAKILAKAVNCLHPVEGDPCNECEVCRGIDDGSILDVTEIDAASNNGVDNIRELRDEVAFTPVLGKYRVYIIDEVHMLSAGAFNALLKTLEEPPAHVIFILATTEVHKLPATILSRCQRFDFNRISPATIAGRLRYVADQEGLTLTDEAALLLARLADGALRDGLSLLDQCASVGGAIDASTVAAVTGMTGQQALADLTACVARQDAAGALSLLDTLYQSAKDMERLCAEWLTYLRYLMVLCSVRDPGGLLIATPEELAAMTAAARQLGLPAILHMMDVLQTSLPRLRSGVSRRVEMEMAVLRLCDPQLNTDTTALIKRIAALENALQGGAIVIPAAQTTAETAPMPVQVSPVEETPAPPVPAEPPVPEAPVEAAEVPFPAWADVLERLRETCMPLYGVLADSQALLKDNMLLVCTDNAMFKTLLASEDNKTQLRQAIRTATGKDYRLGLRSTRVVQKKAADPLSQLLEAGRQAGVPIHEND